MYKGKWKGDEPTQAGPQHWIGAPRPSCTHPAPYPPPNLRDLLHTHPSHPPCLLQPTQSPKPILLRRPLLPQPSPTLARTGFADDGSEAMPERWPTQAPPHQSPPVRS